MVKKCYVIMNSVTFNVVSKGCRMVLVVQRGIFLRSIATCEAWTF